MPVAKEISLGRGVWMMVKRYRVRLAEEEQQGLRSLVSRGRAAAYRQTHARILLLCDENQADGAMKDEEIARALQVGTATVGAGAPALRGGGSGGGLGAQAAAKPAAEEAGWCRGGSPDGLDLLPTAGGPGRLDPATAGGPAG